jgi:hypothetical protein
MMKIITTTKILKQKVNRRRCKSQLALLAEQQQQQQQQRPLQKRQIKTKTKQIIKKTP